MQKLLVLRESGLTLDVLACRFELSRHSVRIWLLRARENAGAE